MGSQFEEMHDTITKNSGAFRVEIESQDKAKIKLRYQVCIAKLNGHIGAEEEILILRCILVRIWRLSALESAANAVIGDVLQNDPASERH
jgi:hypothetical protein